MIKIEVSAKDIKNGARANCRECPIALALKRVFNDKIGVGSGAFWFCEGRDYMAVPLPLIVAEFVFSFDHKKKVEPFSFWLPLS